MKTVKVINHITAWLASYCADAGLNGFVVGVSGGIDSAVVSTICAKSGKPTIALNMPIYQANDQVSLAKKHIEWLENNFNRIKGFTIDLTPGIQALEKLFPGDIQDELTMANTRSRLRMVTLYAFANHHRMLVVGTGNKVEDFGIGFFTKYGDGGVDVLPIGDLLKSEVYTIGVKLGIIREILDSAPVDGLWPDNRTDETQIGATYDELEWAMAFLSGTGGEQELTQRQKEVLSIYQKLRQANRHKMEPIPICRVPRSLR